jgi:hypothetical protein
MKKYLLLVTLSLSFFFANAVCQPGQVEVTIAVKIDAYGNEGYWELLPQGNSCGTGTIFSGGNSSVGCSGAGNQSSPPGGYPNDTTIMEGPWCLTQGASFDIFYADDWQDGGLVFTIYINGYPVHSNLAYPGSNNRYTFVATPPPALDVSCTAIKTPSYVNFGNVYPKAWVKNLGVDTVHSFDLYFMIDNNPTQLSNITGVTIAPFDSLLVSATAAWSLSQINEYGLLMYANNPNGGADMNPSNDSTQRRVTGGPGTPNNIDDYLVGTPVFTVIGNLANDQVDLPVDLDFHPVLTRYELWVLLRGTSNSGGSTVIIYNAGLPNQSSILRTDGNAHHFMDLPSGIAFSENENFSTSPSVYDANHDGGSPFTGPTLWSSDTAIYCHTPPGGNGSHIDMLHQSPYSMGICAEEENRFWVFDDENHAIVMYDFKKDHGPGNSDHSDGVVRQYNGLGISGDPNHVIGSGLILDKSEGLLYIADTWNDRILQMDIHSGAFVSNLTPYEPTAEYSSWNNVTWSPFVSTGVGAGITRPSGIDIIENRMIVSEYGTGDIVIYDRSGTTGVELGRIHTGTPGIMGVKIGPDGKIWYVNSLTNEVIRIDGAGLGTNELSTAVASVYPNPVTENLNILLTGKQAEAVISIIDSKGSVVLNKMIPANEKNISFDARGFSKGVYTISIRTSKDVVVKKFVKS